MKKIITYIFVLCILFGLCGCIIENHTHEYINGKCECGAEDSNYIAPHIHEYINGKCECGAEDSNYIAPHIHEYINGKCECGAEDSNYIPIHIHQFVDNVCECGIDVYEYIINIIINYYKNPYYDSEQAQILYYFGEYDGCQVALVKGDHKPIMGDKAIMGDIVINYRLEQISVYYNNKYFNLQEAIDLNMLSYDNVLKIHDLYYDYLINKG